NFKDSRVCPWLYCGGNRSLGAVRPGLLHSLQISGRRMIGTRLLSAGSLGAATRAKYGVSAASRSLVGLRSKADTPITGHGRLSANSTLFACLGLQPLGKLSSQPVAEVLARLPWLARASHHFQ